VFCCKSFESGSELLLWTVHKSPPCSAVHRHI